MYSYPILMIMPPMGINIMVKGFEHSRFKVDAVCVNSDLLFSV